MHMNFFQTGNQIYHTGLLYGKSVFGDRGNEKYKTYWVAANIISDECKIKNAAQNKTLHKHIMFVYYL